MRWKGVTAAVLAAAAFLAWTAGVQAGDNVRLLGGAGAPTLTLGYQGDDDTVDVSFRRKVFIGGFYPSFYSFNRGFYGRSFYPGFYGGFNRGFYGRSFYPSFYFSRSFYPSFYGRSFYGGGFYPGYRSIYFRISDVPDQMPYAPQAQHLDLKPQPFRVLPWTDSQPPADGGTFPYDGGPRDPVPPPRGDRPADPAGGARPTVPLEGRPVSLPAEPAPFTYKAYGEQRRRTSFAEDRALPVRNEPAKKGGR